MTESYIFTTIIILIISIILWLILREVFLWYWKVNKIVELLEKNNSLLESVLIGKNRKNPIDLLTEIENKPISEKKENDNIEPEKNEKPLSEEIQKLIEKLNKDELIIEIKSSKEIKIIKKEQYNLDKELHLSHKYTILYEN